LLFIRYIIKLRHEPFLDFFGTIKYVITLPLTVAGAYLLCDSADKKIIKSPHFWFKSNDKMNFLSIAYFIATISAAPTPENNTASTSQAVTQGRV
jgi:hypothetical protein